MQIRKKISILLQENHLIIITPLLQAPALDCTNYEIYVLYKYICNGVICILSIADHSKILLDLDCNNVKPWIG